MLINVFTKLSLLGGNGRQIAKAFFSSNNHGGYHLYHYYNKIVFTIIKIIYNRINESGRESVCPTLNEQLDNDILILFRNGIK